MKGQALTSHDQRLVRSDGEKLPEREVGGESRLPVRGCRDGVGEEDDSLIGDEGDITGWSVGNHGGNVEPSLRRSERSETRRVENRAELERAHLFLSPIGVYQGALVLRKGGFRVFDEREDDLFAFGSVKNKDVAFSDGRRDEDLHRWKRRMSERRTSHGMQRGMS